MPSSGLERCFFALALLCGASSLSAAPGDLDSSFVPPFILSEIRAALPLPEGKVLVAGARTITSGVTRSIARLNANGTLDESFTAPVLDGDVWSVGVLPSGQILIAGTFTSAGGVTRNRMARLSANGTLDSAFNPNITGWGAYSLGLQPDGKIVVGGDFTHVGGVSRTRVARLNADGSLDPTFTASADGTVGCILVQRDGKILLGGPFSAVNSITRRGVARVGSTGTLESSFNPSVTFGSGSGNIPEVISLAEMADGKILLGGFFERVSNTSRLNLARLQSDGTLEPSAPVFNPAPNGPVAGLGAQADGKLLVAGEFSTLAGGSRTRLARLTNAGALDTTHTANVGSTPLSLAIQGNGKTLVNGMFTTVSGTSRSRVALLDNDAISQNLTATEATRVQWLRGGTLPEAQWVTFEASTNNGTTWTALGTGTRISGGWELTGVGLPAAGMIRGRACISASGKSVYFLEATHSYSQLPGPEIVVEGPSGQSVANGSTIDLGALPVGGNSSVTLTIRNQGNLPLTGTTPDILGAVSDLDYTLTTPPVFPVPPGGSTTFTVRYSPGGTGLRNGTFHLSNNDGDEANFEIQFTGIGTGPGLLDPTFQSPFANTGGVVAMAVQPDGKVLYGGSFVVGSSPQQINLMRVNGNGTVDGSFYAAANDHVSAVAVLPNGQILVAGFFTDINGVPRTSLARLNSNGTVDPSFAPVFNSHVNSLVVQSDGRVIVGGNFTQVNGTARARLARINPDGTLDPLFNPGTDGEVLCLYYREGDERVFVGGNFGHVGGTQRDYLAAVWLDGAIVTTFTPNLVGGPVHSIFLAPGGGLVIGGIFSLVDGQNRGHIARLTAAGRLDATFSSVNAANRAPVWGLSGQMDGKLIITGYFFEIASQWRHGLARLNGNGTLDATFNPEPWEAAGAATLQADGKVLIAGTFTSIGALPQVGVGRVLNDPAASELTVVGPNQIEWIMSGTFPVPSAVTFEVSTDGQNTWQPLGIGRPRSPLQNGWESVQVVLPVGGHVRALARIHGGISGASSGLIEAITAFGVPPEPEITVQTNTHSNVESGDSFDLGLAPSPGELTRQIRIRNSGPSLLELSQISLQGTDAENFSLIDAPALPLSLSRNQTVEFTLRFAPLTAGTKSVRLRILSNDADESTFELNFSGQALSPVITDGPVSETVDLGTNWALAVTAGGSPPLSYQWYVGSPGDTTQPLGNGLAVVSTGSMTATTSYWVQVSNAFGQAERAFTLSVNNPPTVSVLDDQTTNEDTATGLIPFTIGDPESPPDTLSVSAQSDNQALVDDRAISLGGAGANRQLVITPMPNQSGQAIITLTVSDGRLLTTRSFVLTVQPVNDAPNISALSNRLLAMNTTSQPIEFSISDVDDDPASLTVTAASSNPALIGDSGILLGGSGATRNLTLSPTANQFGTATITVTVSDGLASATSSFVLTVFPPNYPPTLSAIPDQTTNEDTATAPISLTVGDVETPASALVLTGASDNPGLIAPGGLSFSGSGANRTLIITPALHQHGSARLTVTVSDGQLTTSRSFTLTVNSINDAPTISSIANQNTDRATATPTLSFAIDDVDNPLDELTLSGASSNTSLLPLTGIVFTGTGNNRGITLTPAPGQVGSSQVTITVSDGELSATRTFTLNVVIPKPVITSPATATGRRNDPFQYLITATETPTSFAVSGLPAGLTLNSATGLISGTPTVHGTFSVTVSATNAAGSGQRLVNLTIDPPVPPPVVLNPTTLAGTVHALLSVQASATNTPTAWELLNAPAWLSIKPSGMIAGTPPAAGTFNFRIRASNQSGFGDYRDVSLAIEPNPQAPSITSIVEVRGRRGTAFSHALTADPAATSFALVAGSLPPGLAFSPTSGTFSGTPTAAGTYNLALTASNTFGAGRVAPLRIIIDPPLQVPVISSAAFLTAHVGTAFSAMVTASFTPTSFSFSNLPPWLTQTGTTGQISGTPPAAGVFTIDVFATNGDGAGPVQRLVLNVAHHPNAPSILQSAELTAFQGLPFNATLPTSTTATALTATGLPPGISVNSATRTLVGTPTEPGEYQVTLQASNANGIGPAATVRFVVWPTPGTPEISSSLAEFPLGLEPFTYQIQARSAIPVLGYEASGLPTGLRVNAATGVISGTPQVLGPFEVRLSARNAVGVGAESTLLLTVRPGPNVPKITSAASASVALGQTFGYQIVASSNPFAYAAADLPEGLVLNSLTGLITGRPITPGTFDVKLSAANLNGSGPTQILKITVTPTPGAPILTVPSYVYVTEIQPLSMQIEALGMPTQKPWPAGTGIFAENLPPGMSLQSSTGILTGFPRTGTAVSWYSGGLAYYYRLRLYAVSNGLRGQTVLMDVYVRSTINDSFTPIITGPKSLNARTGSNLTFKITADRGLSYHSFDIINHYFETVGFDALGSAQSSLTVQAADLPRPGSWTYRLQGVARYQPAFGSSWTRTGEINGLTLRVDPAPGAPAITSSEFLVGRVGTALSAGLAASGNPVQFEANFAGNSPSGVSFNPTTGQFIGTPTTPGNYSFLAQARNASGWSLPKFTTLAILPAAASPPQSMSLRTFGLRSFSSASSLTTYRVGEAMSYTPEVPFAANYFVITGLPSGLVYNETTGEISGTPQQPGVFTVKLRPFSDTIIGAEVETPFTILPVDGAPAIATDIVIEGTVGEELSYTMTATESPLGFNFTDLPDFVTVDPLTGEVVGTPSTPGTYEMVVSAFNGVGEGMPQVVRFDIAPADGTPVTTLAAPLSGLQVGVPFTAQLQSSPVADFYDSGSLPYGVSLDSASGLISGTPLEPGDFEVPLWGVNAVGQGGSLKLSFSIAPAEGTPVVSNPNVIRLLAEEEINLQFQAEPAAESFTLVPVPEGLVFDPVTGTLTGNLPEGTWVFQVYGTNEVGRGVAKTIQLEVYATPGERWQAENFPGLDPAVADWEAAPAGDGISNLLKYALGLSVWSNSQPSLPQAAIEPVDGEHYLTYTIAKNPGATDVEFIPEIATSLQTADWTSGPEELAILENTPEVLRVRDAIPIHQRNDVFIRLRVVLVED